MPRKAWQRWVKVAICNMELGVKWCNWIPQKCNRPLKKLEVGTARPRSTKDQNRTISLVPSYGLSSPSAERHWTIARDWIRHSSTSDAMMDLDNLHFFHPVAKVSTAFYFPFRLDFFGAIQNVTRCFSRIRSGATDGEEDYERKGIWDLKAKAAARKVWYGKYPRKLPRG